MEPIKISDLLVNNENTRVVGLKKCDILKDQIEIIKEHIKLTKTSEEESFQMSKSIAKIKDIASNLIVYKKPGNDKYIVYEGNRRLIGVLSILNPSLNVKHKDELIEIGKNWPELNDDFEITCFVAKDKDEAKEQANLTNPDKKNGAAKNTWEKYAVNYNNENLPKNETIKFLQFLFDKCGFRILRFQEMNMPWESFKSIFNLSKLKKYNLLSEQLDDSKIDLVKNLIENLNKGFSSLSVDEIRENSSKIDLVFEAILIKDKNFSEAIVSKHSAIPSKIETPLINTSFSKIKNETQFAKFVKKLTKISYVKDIQIAGQLYRVLLDYTTRYYCDKMTSEQYKIETTKVKSNKTIDKQLDEFFVATIEHAQKNGFEEKNANRIKKAYNPHGDDVNVTTAFLNKCIHNYNFPLTVKELEDIKKIFDPLILFIIGH